MSSHSTTRHVASNENAAYSASTYGKSYVRSVVSGWRSGLRPECLITEATAALSARVKFHEES